MILKAALVPLALIFLFGGGFVALTKPFNAKHTGLVVGIGVCLLLIGIASGAPKWWGVVGILGIVAAVILGRLKR